MRKKILIISREKWNINCGLILKNYMEHLEYLQLILMLPERSNDFRTLICLDALIEAKVLLWPRLYFSARRT